MSAQYDRLPLAHQRTHQTLDHLDVDRVQPLKWLVQYQQFRVVNQACNELYLLLHPPAQLLDPLATPLLQFDSLEQTQRPALGRRAVDALEAAQIDQHLQHSLVPVQPTFLRQIADPLAILPRLPSQQRYFARVCLEDIHQNTDRTRLPCAVGPEQTEDLPLQYLKRQLIDSHVGAIPLAQTLSRQHRISHSNYHAQSSHFKREVQSRVSHSSQPLT